MARTNKTMPFTGSWTSRAACRGMDTEMFFPADGERPPERDTREAKAKQVCARCPVRSECLEESLARPDKHGVFGGLNEQERKNELRRRSRRAAA